MEKQPIKSLRAITLSDNPTPEVHFENIDEKIQNILGLLNWRIREYPEFQDLSKNIDEKVKTDKIFQNWRITEHPGYRDFFKNANKEKNNNA